MNILKLFYFYIRVLPHRKDYDFYLKTLFIIANYDDDKVCEWINEGKEFTSYTVNNAILELKESSFDKIITIMRPIKFLRYTIKNKLNNKIAVLIK